MVNQKACHGRHQRHPEGISGAFLCDDIEVLLLLLLVEEFGFAAFRQWIRWLKFLRWV